MCEDNKITLNNILGYEEEKKSIKKIITLLNNYERYSREGISIPRGLILQGPPGTGKTLFAKAIAGECRYKFLTAFKDDEKDENPLVTLKSIFNEAETYSTSTNKPSLVYIDEIDKITHLDRFGEFVDKESREATRFLLQKLDETKSNNKILIIASTNNYSSIPNALLRSGRFDKKIIIDVPDLKSREEILKYYINDRELFKDINIRKLALKTKGMSGADLKTLINNALVEYITIKERLEDDDFIKILQEMHFETIGKLYDSKEALLETLIHEVGHAVVSGVITKNFGEISAIKYGGVGGYTDFSPRDDIVEEVGCDIDSHASYISLINDVIVALGGIAAEKVLLKQLSIGGASDIGYASGVLSELMNLGTFGFKYSSEIVCFPEYTREYKRKLGEKVFKKSVQNYQTK